MVEPGLNQSHYAQYHARRIVRTIEVLRAIRAARIVEIGGYPWAMTAALLADPRFEVLATISVHDDLRWPDDIGVTVTWQEIQTADGRRLRVCNYAANVERTLFDLECRPDTVLACEVIEHLVRAPHVLLLNANRWLPVGGKLLITTPNGAQFHNPLRRRSFWPAYRSNVYDRHAYAFNLSSLVDIVELCGFRVLEAGYWDVYDRRGPARIYDWLSRLPGQYWRDKFKRTIHVLGEKHRTVTELPRLPRVYDHRGEWEFIAAHAGRPISAEPQWDHEGCL